jgi:hypothetical protein
MEDEYKAFCERDAEWYEQRAKEAREAGETDPEKYYKESLRCAQILCHVLPVIVKKSLESDEFRAGQTILAFQERLLRYRETLRDVWRRASVAGSDLLKGLVDVQVKVSEHLRVLLQGLGVL